MSAAPGTLEIVWSAYRSVLSRGRLAYVSAPITSGLLALEGLPRTEVIQRNLAAGNSLARSVADRVSVPVVAPTIFDGNPQRWSQQDYMAMWLRMIEENVGDVYMTPGWNYSNGCAEEYLRAVSLGYGFGSRSDILPRRPDGSVLHLHEGVEGLTEALHAFHDRGQRADALAGVLIGLLAVWRAWRTPEIQRDLPAAFNPVMVDGADSSRVCAAVRAAEPLLRNVYAWGGELKVHLASGPVRELAAWPEGVVVDEVRPTCGEPGAE